MRAIGLRRLDRLDVAWFAFALINVGAMLRWPSWETIPFHLIWFTLTVLYGFRVWALKPTFVVLVAQGIVTGLLISHDAMNGTQEWGELFEVPLMSAMFLAMVWHARRHRAAAEALAGHMRERASILARQERFLHDVSHELRTPITIARGHLETLRRSGGDPGQPEVAVAIDELSRMERIVERLLLLVRAGQTDFAATAEDVDLETLIEDVGMRWAEVAPRVWRIGRLAAGTVRMDQDALRIALDALVENAVAHTDADGRHRASCARRPRAGRGRRGRRRLRHPPRGARQDLRALRSGRPEPRARRGRRGPRARDRRRDRHRARRALHGEELAARVDVHARPARVHACDHAAGTVRR